MIISLERALPTMRKARRLFTVGATTMLGDEVVVGLEWVSLVTRHSVKTIEQFYSIHSHGERTIAAGHHLASKTFGVHRSSFPPLEFEKTLLAWKDVVSSPMLSEDTLAVQALAKLCAARKNADDSFVAWCFDELDIFYASQLHELKKLAKAPQPQIVQIATPLLMGRVFYCCIFPNSLYVNCDCCGKLLHTFSEIDSSKFIFKNDGAMSHSSLPEPLPVVDERLKLMGFVSIQMCGRRKDCEKADCLCNLKAVLRHSDFIQTNICSKTESWVNERCVWNLYKRQARDCVLFFQQ